MKPALNRNYYYCPADKSVGKYKCPKRIIKTCGIKRKRCNQIYKLRRVK